MSLPSTEPLDSRRLRGFLLIAKTGSIAMAAEAMGLTSSAMSHSLKSLEEELGCELFERRGHKAILTGAGERLRPRVERILAEMSLAREEQRTLSQWGGGSLRLGASASICRSFLPDVLLEFRECFPNCQLDVVSVDARSAHEQIQAGTLDLAISVSVPEVLEDVGSKPLFEDELLLVVSPRHPWAELSRVSAKELRGQKLIVYSRDSVSTQLVQQHLRQLGAEKVSLLTISSMEAIKEMARVGLCPGVVADWVAERDVQKGMLHALRLSGPALQRKWVALWPAHRPLSIMAQTLLGLCGDVLTAQRVA